MVIAVSTSRQLPARRRPDRYAVAAAPLADRARTRRGPRRYAGADRETAAACLGVAVLCYLAATGPIVDRVRRGPRRHCPCCHRRGERGGPLGGARCHRSSRWSSTRRRSATNGAGQPFTLRAQAGRGRRTDDHWRSRRILSYGVVVVAAPYSPPVARPIAGRATPERVARTTK